MALFTTYAMPIKIATTPPTIPNIKTKFPRGRYIADRNEPNPAPMPVKVSFIVWSVI